MKKFLLFVLLFFISACVDTNYKFLESKPEQLRAVLFNNNKLYLVGDLTDYQFEGEDVAALQNFLQSPFAKLAKAEITDLTIYDHETAWGSYKILLNTQTLTEAQIQTLQKQYGFKTSKQGLVREYSAYDGKLVKLENREELLNKYAFAHPLRTEVQFKKSYSRINVEGTQMLVGLIAVSPILIAGTVIAAPFAIFCKAIDSCH